MLYIYICIFLTSYCFLRGRKRKNFIKQSLTPPLWYLCKSLSHASSTGSTNWCFLSSKFYPRDSCWSVKQRAKRRVVHLLSLCFEHLTGTVCPGYIRSRRQRFIKDWFCLISDGPWFPLPCLHLSIWMTDCSVFLFLYL